MDLFARTEHTFFTSILERIRNYFLSSVEIREKIILNDRILTNKWRIIFIRNTLMILDNSLVWNFDR